MDVRKTITSQTKHVNDNYQVITMNDGYYNAQTYSGHKVKKTNIVFVCYHASIMHPISCSSSAISAVYSPGPPRALHLIKYDSQKIQSGQTASSQWS